MQNKFFNLNGKTALVTGAAGLLGIEHSKALLENNCDLVLTDIDLEKLFLVKKQLENKALGSNIHIYNMDVSSKSSILNVFNKLEESNIYIDILINNAALNPKVEKENIHKNFTRLETFSLDSWNLEISIGLTGAFLCSQIFGTAMSKSHKGGCILNISSDLSVIAPDQRIYKKSNLSEEEQPVKPITYSVIKTGLIGLTKYLATYWIGKNIRCNSLSPGGIYTSQPDEFREKLSSLIPLGRMANKDEYKSAIQFLCSDASSYLNGHNLVMDGGRSIW